MLAFATPAPDPRTLAGYAGLLARHVYQIAWSAFDLAFDALHSTDQAVRLMNDPALWRALGEHWSPGPPVAPDPADFAEVVAGLKDPRLGLDRWAPDPALYAAHALCFDDVAALFGREVALEWCAESASRAQRLCTPGLGVGDAAEIVVGWHGAADRLLGAAGPPVAPRANPNRRPRAERPADPDRMSVKDAAAHARVSAPIVYGWCNGGALAHSRVGATRGRGRVVILRADLDAFLDSLRRPAGAGAPVPPARPSRRQAPRPAFRHLNLG